MDDKASGVDHGIENWRQLLIAAAENREPTVTAETFLKRWNSYSKPVALHCDDGNDYVVKGKHAGRAIVNDQIIARLGVALGAPVGIPRIVNLPHELISFEPQLNGISAGLAHGTLLIPNCTDREWLTHIDSDENRDRFALLAVLYGWCKANDHQLIYENMTPYLVHSVDHGHFFPGGPGWTIDNLTREPQSTLDQKIVAGCRLSITEQRSALLSIESVSENAIIHAVAAPPDEWGITIDERVALVDFLTRRRAELLVYLDNQT